MQGVLKPPDRYRGQTVRVAETLPTSKRLHAMNIRNKLPFGARALTRAPGAREPSRFQRLGHAASPPGAAPAVAGAIDHRASAR